MRRFITQKIAMFKRVIQVCDEHPVPVDANLFFKSKLAAFKLKLEQVEDTAELLGTDENGLAESKSRLKKKLANILDQVCGSLQAIASATDDTELYYKANMTESYFLRLRDEDLVVKANVIDALAQTHATALAEIGWTPAMLAVISSRIEAFNIVNPKPVANITSGKTLRMHLFDMVWEMNNFLRTSMDKAARVYQTTDELFYSYYRNARRTFNQGLRHKQPEEGQELVMEVFKAPAADMPLAELAAPPVKPAVNGVSMANGVH